MNTKLTLKMDQSVIESAKLFARAHHTSLSKLVEAYFRSLDTEPTASERMAPGVVGELAGVLKGKEIGSGRQDFKRGYIDYLEKKYQ